MTNDLDPILIASAVRRSGTTLIQRLLCSAKNCLIYGESCANELNFFSQIVLSKQLVFGPSLEFRDGILEEVLKGNVDDWIADLMPPIRPYLESYDGHFQNFLNHLKDFAASKNRNVWGMKMAEWPSANLIQIQKVMLRTKLIYIHRDLLPTVRSAKGIDMVRDVQEIDQFCSTWKENFERIKENFPTENLLIIDYQNLMDNPREVIKEMEAFTGAEGIDPEVMKKKINTYKFDDRQPEDARTGYLKPGELLPGEIEIIEKYSV